MVFSPRGQQRSRFPKLVCILLLLDPRTWTPHSLILSPFCFATLLSNLVPSWPSKKYSQSIQSRFLNSGRTCRSRHHCGKKEKPRELFQLLSHKARGTQGQGDSWPGFLLQGQALSVAVGGGSPGLCPPLHPGAVVRCGGPAAHGGQVLRAGQRPTVGPH